MPECTDERKIGEKIMKGLVFSDYYRDVMKELMKDQEEKASLNVLFNRLHHQETAYRRYHAKKSKKKT